jgi:hypothetical protein
MELQRHLFDDARKGPAAEGVEFDGAEEAEMDAGLREVEHVVAALDVRVDRSEGNRLLRAPRVHRDVALRAVLVVHVRVFHRDADFEGGAEACVDFFGLELKDIVAGKEEACGRDDVV